MFSFFKKRNATPIDFSFLGVDIHSHLIPGIDDGARTIEESLELVKGMVELGFKRLITTPHVMLDFYPNTREEILTGLEKLRRAVAEAGIEVEIHASAEYHIDEEFENLLEGKNFLVLPGNFVLIEPSFIQSPPGLDTYLFQMQTKGYRPIMAHPERYGYWQGDLDNYEQLRISGCHLQVNLLSLAGHYGAATRKTAFKLIRSGLVEFLGSDLHNRVHLDELRELLKDGKVRRALQDLPFRNREFGDGQ